MKKQTKRILSMMIVLVMLFSALYINTTESNAATTSGWRWPIEGQIFGRGWNGSHKAIDIQAGYGTTVVAAKEGTVVCASTVSSDASYLCPGCQYYGAGYHVVIQHPTGQYSFYDHLSSVSVKKGAYVTGGQKIGGVGATGNATGNHLHFAISSSGLFNLTDPLKILTPFSSVRADVSADNVILTGVFGAYGPTMQTAGFYIGTDRNNLKKVTETLNTNGYTNGNAILNINYSLSKWYPNLVKGNTYYYKMYITRDGVEYCSDIYSFQYGSHTHSYNAGTITKQPTCTDSGVKTYTCTGCGAVKTDSMPALGHQYTSVVVAPIPGKQGYTIHTCSTCGNSYKDSYTDYVATTDPVIYADDVTARSGSTITVPVYVENNPGAAYTKLKISYSECLTLLSAVNQNLFTGTYTTSKTTDTKPYVVQWMGAEDASADGCCVILTFRIAENAAEGAYHITIACEEAYNSEYEDIPFTIVNPTVTVKNLLPGDLNGDGTVNGKDGVLLAQYLADWDVSIDIAAADVNGDGTVNGKDGILLAQYLADWDVVLGK